MAVLQYQAMACALSGPDLTDVVIDGPSGTADEPPPTAIEISALEPGALYEFHVRARNRIGWGLWSATAEAPTHDEAPSEVTASQIRCS